MTGCEATQAISAAWLRASVAQLSLLREAAGPGGGDGREQQQERQESAEVRIGEGCSAFAARCRVTMCG